MACSSKRRQCGRWWGWTGVGGISVCQAGSPDSWQQLVAALAQAAESVLRGVRLSREAWGEVWLRCCVIWILLPVLVKYRGLLVV